MKFYVNKILQELPKEVTLVAATKYFTPSQMRELYQLNVINFGENRVEAFLEKYEELQDLDITWHFIGTLQTKKVKKIINKIDVLHSLESFNQAEEINKRRTSPLKCFIEVNISNEETKHGFELEEVESFIKEVQNLPNIQIIGFMGMATHTTDEAIIHSQFQKLNDLQKLLPFNDLSIGMSNDYKIALAHHATYIRLGSILYEKEV